jgi:hypothetical protein
MYYTRVSGSRMLQHELLSPFCKNLSQLYLEQIIFLKDNILELKCFLSCWLLHNYNGLSLFFFFLQNALNFVYISLVGFCTNYLGELYFLPALEHPSFLSQWMTLIPHACMHAFSQLSSTQVLLFRRVFTTSVGNFLLSLTPWPRKKL